MRLLFEVTMNNLRRAKSLISEVISRAGNRPPPGRPFDNNGVTNMGGGGGRGQQVTQELLIPGPKCGLIIGKGGETIKNHSGGNALILSN